MVFKSINRNFSLKDCKAGKPCRTVSNQDAKYIFTSSGLAPVVMLIGEWFLENYTIDGRHLFDPRLDLVMEQSTVNQLSDKLSDTYLSY